VNIFSIVLVILLTSLTTLLADYVAVEADSYTLDTDMYITVTANTIFDVFTKPLEHTIEIDANQLFPNETLKREIINKTGPLEFTMPTLNYNLLGFNISATDLKVVANVTQITDNKDQSQKMRFNFPVMLADNVNVSNGVIKQNFEDVDLASIFAIYDPTTDKFQFRVPFDLVARFLLRGK
jgi:hypothetical protein